MKCGTIGWTIAVVGLGMILAAPLPAQARKKSAEPLQATEFAAAVVAFNQADYPSALHMLQHLADGGYAPAQNNLGMMYATGQGAPQDYAAAAAALLRSAAVQGYALGEYDLGAMYGNGLGMP